jgi:hypothetical protein
LDLFSRNGTSIAQQQELSDPARKFDDEIIGIGLGPGRANTPIHHF